MNWCTETDSAVSIPPKNLSGTPLPVTVGQVLCLAAVLVVLLPLGVLIVLDRDPGRQVEQADGPALVVQHHSLNFRSTHIGDLPRALRRIVIENSRGRVVLDQLQTDTISSFFGMTAPVAAPLNWKDVDDLVLVPLRALSPRVSR